MPPEENTNKNIPDLNKVKVDIDPVFKGNTGITNNIPDQNPSLSAYKVLTDQKFVSSQPKAPVFTGGMQKPASPISLIRTYKSDLESAAKNDHLSSVNIAIAQNQKIKNQMSIGINESTAQNMSKTSKILIFISIVLVVAGIAGVVTYFVMNPSPKPVVQVQEFPSLITAEYKDTLDTDLIDRDNFISTLSGKLNDTQIPLSNLYNILLTTGSSTGKRLITSGEFISLIKLAMPDTVKRSLTPDFMVGMYSGAKNLPLIIFKTSYFDNAYAGMLNWEKNMKTDLRPLFRLSGYDNNGGILAELAATSTRQFEDGVIVNQDVRLLRDDSGQIMLVYGIINKEMIIITVSDQAFKEIITRLNNEKTLKR